MHSIKHHEPSKRLHVVAVVSNPVGYHSRYRLFREFQAYMATQDVNLIVVEQAFGARDHVLTDTGNPNHVQVRGHSELWVKESLINRGFQALPHDWQYAAWIDADLRFLSSTWVEDTLHALQHHRVVQMFQHALDMGPRGEVLQTHTGFGYLYSTGAPMKAKGYAFPHPGYAWAITREAYEAVGRLVDFAILGAADHHMAWSLIGKIQESLPAGLHPNYLRRLAVWQSRAEHFIKRDVGYVPGTLVHHFHGKKRDRRYIERWRILIDNGFDPDADIKLNHSGVIELDGRNLGLREGIRSYMRARNEDSIDLD